MRRVALLDVNVLVALFDPDHVHHDLAHDWFAEPAWRRMGDVPGHGERSGAASGESARSNGGSRSADVERCAGSGLIRGRHVFWE